MVESSPEILANEEKATTRTLLTELRARPLTGAMLILPPPPPPFF